MKILTITQEYTLCALNQQGELSAEQNQPPAVGVSAFIELMQQGFITIINNKIIVQKELEAPFLDLAPIYNVLNNKTMDIPTFLQKVFTSKNIINELINNIKKTLKNEGLVKEVFASEDNSVLIGALQCVSFR